MLTNQMISPSVTIEIVGVPTDCLWQRTHASPKARTCLGELNYSMYHACMYVDYS